MHSSKKINVFPFSLFGFCYEVYLHFLAIASKTLSARTFAVPRLKYLRNCMSCFSSPKDPSAWMLLFILRRIPSSERIRSKSSSRYFKNVFATRKHFVSLFYWCFTVIPLDTLFLVRAIFTFFTLINGFFTDVSGFRFRATEMCKGQLFPIFTNIRVTFFRILIFFYTTDIFFYFLFFDIS